MMPGEPQDRELAQDLRRWLEDEAPDTAPSHLLGRVVTSSTAGKQRRRWVDALGAWTRPPQMRAVGAAIGLVVMPVLVAGMLLSSNTIGPAASSPTPTACPGPGQGRAAERGSSASRLAGALVEPRYQHTATEIGPCRVLIVGGGSPDADAMSSVELWESASATSTLQAPLPGPRRWHTATRLHDGRVLIVGGSAPGRAGDPGVGPVLEGLVWDPDTRVFEPAGVLDAAFTNHSATLLPDGRVLVVGGGPDASGATLWDPSTESFVRTGPLVHGRTRHTATLLPDGRVMVVGGLIAHAGSPPPDGEQSSAVEIWDPTRGLFAEAPPLPAGRLGHTATILPDGRILVAGGDVTLTPGGRPTTTQDTLVRDPATGAFIDGGALITPRSGHAAELLPDGGVLLIGGATGTEGAEAWDPMTGTSVAMESPSPRIGHRVTLLSDGTLLLSGGVLPAPGDSEGRSAPMALDLEVYDPTTP